MTADGVRLALHVIAACVWVGGQFVLAGLVGTLRSIDPDAPRRVARRFNLLAWPAYGVLLFTGLWNLLTGPIPSSWHPWIELKVLAFLLSGLGAAAHSRARSNRVVLAVGGAASSLFAVVALLVGTSLRFL